MTKTRNMVIVSFVLILASLAFVIWQNNENRILSSNIYEKEVQIAKLSDKKVSLEAEIAKETTLENVFAMAEEQNINLTLMPGKGVTVVASN